MKCFSLFLIVFLLISPTLCWEWFFSEKRDYVPPKTYLINATTKLQPAIATNGYVSAVEQVNILDEIQLNTTAWNCIKVMLKNRSKDRFNFTDLLLTAVNENNFERMQACYVEAAEENPGWWKTFMEGDVWNFVKDYYWCLIIAAIAALMLLTTMCELCKAICKKNRADEVLIS